MSLVNINEKGLDVDANFYEHKKNIDALPENATVVAYPLFKPATPLPASALAIPWSGRVQVDY